MLSQFRVRLHFRTIHDPVFDWLFGTGSLPTARFGFPVMSKHRVLSLKPQLRLEW
jgi:hypothetical protein